MIFEVNILKDINKDSNYEKDLVGDRASTTAYDGGTYFSFEYCITSSRPDHRYDQIPKK